MIENAMTFTELISRYDVGLRGRYFALFSDAYRRCDLRRNHDWSELESMISWLADLDPQRWIFSL